jgi:hypothetical protein
MSTWPVTARSAPRTSSGPGRTTAVALMVGVLALAASGVGLLVALIERDEVPALPVTGPFGVREHIPTSFGSVAVDRVRETQSRGSVRIRAILTLTNALDTPVRYAPAHFRLLAGLRRTSTGDTRAGFAAGSLGPRTSIRGIVEFVTPRTRAPLWMEYTDPRAGMPIRIDLGLTGTIASARAGAPERATHRSEVLRGAV